MMAEGISQPAQNKEFSACTAIVLVREEPASNATNMSDKVEDDNVTVLYERVPSSGLSAVNNDNRCDISNQDGLQAELSHKDLANKKRIKRQNGKSAKKKHLSAEETDNHASSNDGCAEAVYKHNKFGSANESEIEDAFYRFIETKVTTIQRDTKSEKARNIQESIAENLKYFLKVVEKLEPVFRVSELIQVGSYAEGTKINEPNEFDFLAVVDLLSKEGTITIDHNKAPWTGCVSVLLADKSLNTDLDRFCEKGELQCFQSTSLSNSFFGPAKFGSTFIKAVRNTFKEKVYKFRSSGAMTMSTPIDIDFAGGGLILPPVNGIYLLLKKVQFKTPNILLEYELEGLEIGVDLSPAIRYHKIEDCIDSEKCASPELLEAIRKNGSVLFVGNKLGGFRTTVTECEVKYMQEIIKKRHKLLYIFLKHMCHIFRWSPFTSYMLKQMCLHHDAKCESENEALALCFEKIIQDMTKYCAEMKLPTVHNKDVDLFYGGIQNEIIDWHSRLHFLIVLRELHRYSVDMSNTEGFEAVLNDSVSRLGEKFSDFLDPIRPIRTVPFDMLPSLFTGLEDGLELCALCDDVRTAESSGTGKEQLPSSSEDNPKHSVSDLSEGVLSCLLAPDCKSSASSSSTKNTESVLIENDHSEAASDLKSLTNTTPTKNTVENPSSNEREQSEILLCLPASNPNNVASTSSTENTDGNSALNERVLLCLPGPGTKSSECTSSTDGVYVLYERVPRVRRAETNAQNTHSPDQKEEFYSVVTDSNQTNSTEKTEQEDNQEPIKDQLQTFVKNEQRTTEMKDAVSTFIQSKVTTIQANVKGEKARNIQEAVVESLKYYLSEVEKLEPLFCVSELLQVGSYAEGTKILGPDEFDFLAVIDSLSREGIVVLDTKPNDPGSVTLSLTDSSLSSSLSKLCDETGDLECFQDSSLAKAFAGPAKFGKMFVQAVQNSLDKVFTCLSSPFAFRTPLRINFASGGLLMPPVNGVSLVLKDVDFRTPNVFLTYKLDNLKISVDLSPAIRFKKTEDCIDSEKCTSPELMKAIGKHGSVLLVGNKTGGFRVTATECEVMYMQEIMKTKHKLLYIFLKYMCYMFKEKTLLWPFTSYMLKNICLHHDVKCHSENETLKTCFENILMDITTYCAMQKLPSLLNMDINLFYGSLPSSDFDWHLRQHFLSALWSFHNFSGEITGSEMLETVLNDIISWSAEKFKVWKFQPSCEGCEMNVTG